MYFSLLFESTLFIFKIKQFQTSPNASNKTVRIIQLRQLPTMSVNSSPPVNRRWETFLGDSTSNQTVNPLENSTTTSVPQTLHTSSSRQPHNTNSRSTIPNTRRPLSTTAAAAAQSKSRRETHHHTNRKTSLSSASPARRTTTTSHHNSSTNSDKKKGRPSSRRSKISSGKQKGQKGGGSNKRFSRRSSMAGARDHLLNLVKTTHEHHKLGRELRRDHKQGASVAKYVFITILYSIIKFS